jgi:hypothetical protein
MLANWTIRHNLPGLRFILFVMLVNYSGAKARVRVNRDFTRKM